MGLVRTAKSLVGRLDNRYIIQPNRGRLYRRTLIAVCSFAVLVGWGVYVGRGDKTPYSPGPLTSAHGMWDGNNCGWCHEAKPGGGFVLTVSNDACTRCHDGAVHHPNVGMQFTPAGGGPARDAGTCTSCHVEHRGHDRLVARADNTCTQCHADLAAAAAKPDAVAVQPKVTAFAAGAHPAFGRSLTDEKKWAAAGTPALRDPTPLSYNHKKHQEEEGARTKPLPGQVENCTACHRVAGTGPARGDIAPVNYAMDCARCHTLQLAAGLSLPHEDLTAVTQAAGGLLAGVQTRALRELAAMSDEQRKAALDSVNPAAKPAAPAGGGGSPFGRKPAAPAAPAAPPPGAPPFGRRPGAAPAATPPAAAGTAPAAVALTPEQLTERWVNSKLMPFAAAITQWYAELKDGELAGPSGEYKKAVGLPDELPAASAENPAATSLWRDDRVLALYVAYKTTGTACVKCHSLSAAAPKPEQSLANLVRHAGPPMSPEAVRKVLPPELLVKLGAPMASLPAAITPATTGSTSGPATAPGEVGTAAMPATEPAAAAATGGAPAEVGNALSPLAAGPLSTLPTGFAQGPRRWFVGARWDAETAKRRDRLLTWPSSSHFDHRAHRMVSCLDCHGDAKKSEKTSDVLMPTMESCTKCHAPRTAMGNQGAEARCQVCHDYHDRSKERPIDGRYRRDELVVPTPPILSSPATRPAEPATGAVAEGRSS